MAFTEIAINYTVNSSIAKAPFKVLYGENILFPIDFFLSRKSHINPHAHNFASKMKQLVAKAKIAMHDT